MIFLNKNEVTKQRDTLKIDNILAIDILKVTWKEIKIHTVQCTIVNTIIITCNSTIFQYPVVISNFNFVRCMVKETFKD